MIVLKGKLDQCMAKAANLGLNTEDSTYGNDLSPSFVVWQDDGPKYKIFVPNTLDAHPDDEEFNHYTIQNINGVDIEDADLDEFEFDHLLMMIAGNDETFNAAYEEISLDIPMLKAEHEKLGTKEIHRFRQLHDVVDANTYGLDMGDEIDDEPDNTEFYRLMNNMQSHLDWLIQSNVLKFR